MITRHPSRGRFPVGLLARGFPLSPVVLVLLALIALPTSGAAQGLAAIAQQEQARRKSVKQAGKVYTNDDLKPDITKQAAEPVPADEPKPDAAPSTTVPSVNLPGGKVDEVTPPVTKDQAYWSGRITAARSALDRSRIFAEALQSRLNALAADFVNRDDPAQRAQIDLERQRSLNELERVKKEMVVQAKAIADIEEDGRKAGIPPAWLR